MSSKDEKIEYLREYLTYEVVMLRYAYGQLLSCENKLKWNAFFECCALHARSLYNFLTDRDKDDTRIYTASDFCTNFKPKDTSITQTINRIDNQVLHLGTTRAAEQKDKVQAKRLTAVLNWIEKNINLFRSKLDKAYADAFDPDKHLPIPTIKYTQDTTTASVRDVSESK